MWDAFGGSRGKLRESRGKIAGNVFPNREMLQILGFQAPGKANLPRTLGRYCLDLLHTFGAGCFLKSTVPAFSSFLNFAEKSQHKSQKEIKAIFGGAEKIVAFLWFQSCSVFGALMSLLVS